MVLLAPAPLTHGCMHVCLSTHMSVFYQNFCMGMTPASSPMILYCTNILLSESGSRHWNRLQVLFQRTPCAIIELKKTECLHKSVDSSLRNIFLQFSHILSSIASIEMLTQQDFSGRDWFSYWLLYHGEITVFSNISCICIQNRANQLHKDRSLHCSLLEGHSETNACTLVFTHLCDRQSFTQMSLYYVVSCHSTWPDSCHFASFLHALTFLPCAVAQAPVWVPGFHLLASHADMLTFIRMREFLSGGLACTWNRTSQCLGCLLKQ